MSSWAESFDAPEIRAIGQTVMKLFGWLVIPIVSALTACSVQKEELVLVEASEPRAEIVVAPERPRMVTLAALELQYYLQKISGAKLPIVTAPSDSPAVKIFVGDSPGVRRIFQWTRISAHGCIRG